MSTAMCPLILPVNTKDIQGNPHKHPCNHPQNNTTGGNGISSQSIRSGAENPAFPRPKKLRRAAGVCRGSLAGGQRVGREELDARGVELEAYVPPYAEENHQEKRGVRRLLLL